MVFYDLIYLKFINWKRRRQYHVYKEQINEITLKNIFRKAECEERRELNKNALRIFFILLGIEITCSLKICNPVNQVSIVICSKTQIIKKYIICFSIIFHVLKISPTIIILSTCCLTGYNYTNQNEKTK